MPTDNHPLIRAATERAAQAKAAAQERRSLTAEDTKFGSRWTKATPEPQHSGTILWMFVSLVMLCAIASCVLSGMMK